MNAKEFSVELKQRLDLEDGKVESLIEKFSSLLHDELVCCNSVVISNFGVFEVRKKEERVSVNPVSKQRMLIPPKLSIAFKPSVVLKDRFKVIEK